MSLGWIGAGAGTLAAALALLFGCTDILSKELPPISGDAFDDDGSTERPRADPPPEGAAATEPDELCALHQRMTAAMATVAGNTDPASGAVRSQALIDFYAAAAGAVDEPDAAAFRAMFDYWDATRRWSERQDGTDLELSHLLERPTVPSDASRRTAELLEVRCGVVPPSDADGG
ncbi:MAG: hypothetical protein ACRD0A_10930 [Acidimicrobiales bacterium]